MQAIVINLARRADRRRQFEAWNHRQPIAFEYLEAVEGSKLSRAELIAEGLIQAETDHYSLGSLGNSLSHRRIWLRAVETGETLLVFEDDACLRGDFTRIASVLMQNAAAFEILVLGYNTNTHLEIGSPEGLICEMSFDQRAKGEPAFYDRFSDPAVRLASPTIFRCFQFWGMLGYLVTPAGAAKLLAGCWPLAKRIFTVKDGRQGVVNTIDGVINTALGAGTVRAYCVFPPLVLGPNDVASSDVVRPA